MTPAKIKEHEPTAVKRDPSDQKIVEESEVGKNPEGGFVHDDYPKTARLTLRFSENVICLWLYSGRITGIPLPTVQSAIPHLVQKGLVKESRPVGNTTM